MPIIKTKRFILRPPRKSDAGSIVKHLNDIKVSRCLSSVSFPYTIKDAKQWIKKCREVKGEALRFVINIEKEAVGVISLEKIKLGHKAELGYWLGRKYWGKGIMTKAVRAVLKHGFRRYKLRRIQAHVFTSNQASVRVLEKAGFKLEGLLRKAVKKGDRILDAYIFGKIK